MSAGPACGKASPPFVPSIVNARGAEPTVTIAVEMPVSAIQPLIKALREAEMACIRSGILGPEGRG